MNRLVYPIAVAFVIVAYLPPMEAESEKPYLGKVFFGIEGEEVPVPEDPRYESTWGLELQRVAAMSSAREAGLRVGDIVVSIDGTVWKNEQIRLSRSFGKAGDKARPGEVASCLVLRKDQARPNAPRTLETVNVTLLRYPRTQPDQPRPPTNDELRPDLTEGRPSYQQVCWELVEEAGFRDGSLDLLRRLDRCDQFPDPDRLPIVRYVLRDPFKLEAVSRKIIDALAHEPERGTPRSEDFLRLARHVPDSEVCLVRRMIELATQCGRHSHRRIVSRQDSSAEGGWLPGGVVSEHGVEVYQQLAVGELDAPDASHDLCVIHIMLHDVPADERIAIREPTREKHGTPELEIRDLMSTTGLHRISAKHSRNLFMGALYDGVFGRQKRRT